MNTGTICQWHENPRGNRTGALIKVDGESKEVHLSVKDFEGDIDSLELEQRVAFEIHEFKISPGRFYAKNCQLLETMSASSTTNAVSIPTDEGLSSEDTGPAALENSQTHLILTVGTNALPVWVAWYHLKERLHNPKVGFIYTDETKETMECLKDYCKGASFLDNIKATSPGRPHVVQGTIEGMLNNLPDDPNIHVHYTGGTQVMGVETVSTIATKRQAVERSYLDARNGSSPIIIDRNGNQIGPEDARERICPDINRIAELNGFEVQGKRSGSPGPSDRSVKRSAWYALENSLKDITNKKNYKVFYDVTVMPKGSNSTFKFDLVAVLGYQVVVVNYKPEERDRKNQPQDTVKMFAIRTYHQAKQLGGDEARAIVLCDLEENGRRAVENELHRDIGSKDIPLQVWGKDVQCKLKEKFDTYLKGDLQWIKKSETGTIQKICAKSSLAAQQKSRKIQNLFLFTVGTNALPVWVAWCHLKKQLNNPTVGFIYTEKTKKTMERLQADFKCNGASDFLHIPLSDPGNPEVIGDAIKGMLSSLPNDPNIHVHYTGGTQVMGVETVSTIATKRPAVERSYLDARSETIPKIVDRNGEPIGPKDTRDGICPDLKKIAALNGFEVSSKGYKRNSAPIDPKNFASDNLDPDECEKLRVASAIPEQLKSRNSGVQRKINCFPSGIWLEYAALAALKEALEQIEHRDNYALFRGIYVWKKEDTQSNSEPKSFELDVVAVLGYQVILVSCTTDENNKSLVRKKAVEAYLRAQQLGGDEARAIMLCGVDAKTEKSLENGLKDDTGSKDVPLQVWGKNRWHNLSDKFKRYLQTLGWK